MSALRVAQKNFISRLSLGSGRRRGFLVPLRHTHASPLAQSKIVRRTTSMAAVCLQSFSRFSRCSSQYVRFINKNHLQCCRNRSSYFLSGSRLSPLRNISQSNLGLILTGFGAGAVVGIGYTVYSIAVAPSSSEIPKLNEAVHLTHSLLQSKPDVPVSRQIRNVNDKTNLKLTLFQYPTCPFCCKVRAFLDYYGISYDVIEVDPVLRQQTSWSNYKKVPILLVETSEGYQQLNDSTMIISALTSFLCDKKLPLKNILEFYPQIEYEDENGKKKTDILNKYFLMFQDSVPRGKVYENVKNERYWRQWADDVLVHTLSPNVYRTPGEAMQAFNWFSEVGEWERLFPSWERNLIVYVGAGAMWVIGKILRKRHGLKEDVRESLYDECKKWMKNVKINGSTFLGGSTPNLADLAVYGVLSSIEGCLAFQDLLKNTNIGNWYYPMKESVSKHEGKPEVILTQLHGKK